MIFLLVQLEKRQKGTTQELSYFLGMGPLGFGKGRGCQATARH